MFYILDMISDSPFVVKLGIVLIVYSLFNLFIDSKKRKDLKLKKQISE